MAEPIKFPEVALLKIFSHLDSNTKVSASSVCTEWKRLFNEDPHLMQDVCVYFVAISLKSAFLIFSKMSRKFSCFHFNGATIDQKCFEFLEQFSNQFQSLTFDRCAIRPELSGRKLEKCEKLLKLRVWGCDALGIFPHIPTLKSLHFEISKSYFVRDLMQLWEIAPLSLTDFGMVDLGERDAEFLKSFYPDIEDFIKRRSSSLKSLDFTGLIFLDSDMLRLAEIKDLRLKRFKVSSHFMLDSTIGSFCHKQRWIVALELGDHISPKDSNPSRRESSAVKDINVVDICNSLPELEELTLSCCTRINESVAKILQLRFLRKLNLARCRGIKDHSFQSALARLACTDLRNLNLWETLIEPSTLSQLMALVPKLGEITLSQDKLREITLSHGHNLDPTWVECRRSRTGDIGYGIKFVRQLY